MKFYKPNADEVKAWLNDGGAELVLETVRRMGWPVDVSDEWTDDSDEIALSSWVDGWERTSVNCKKSGYEQAVAAVAAVHGVRSYRRLNDNWRYPVFRDGDDSKMSEPSLRSIIEFCDTVRRSSEAAAAMTAERKETRK